MIVEIVIFYKLNRCKVLFVYQNSMATKNEGSNPHANWIIEKSEKGRAGLKSSSGLDICIFVWQKELVYKYESDSVYLWMIEVLN